MLSATVRVTRDLDLAEECVQEAYAQALTQWQTDGLPAKPGAWLTTVARRRGLDVVRREATGRRLLPLLQVELEGESDYETFPDDRLRLMFICCHPALTPDAQIALTLRLVCGLRTPEVARAFLVGEATMAARITRAKKKIAQARIPFKLPERDQLPQRLAAVLDVVHLVFTAGHTAAEGSDLVRRDLVERSLDLSRLLREMLPGDADVAGLLALILLTDARRETRVAGGKLVLLENQDRSRWDREAIAEGVTLVREALRRRPPARYALQAAIAAVHAEATRFEDTDWREVAALYGILATVWPSPVVTLNRAVALGMAHGADKGLVELDALAGDPQLAGYAYLPAARAEFLRRLGRFDDARVAYGEAAQLTGNDVERAHLERRLAELG
ncbi:MAG: polymerase sigma-70 factor, subfamily [Frankiales bacterium]|nr:polymerase sigma-70 factor, subfamily [Frankiales bacterium]